MICKNCNGEYDADRFPFCPYCLTSSQTTEAVKEENQTSRGSLKKSDDGMDHSVFNEEKIGSTMLLEKCDDQDSKALMQNTSFYASDDNKVESDDISTTRRKLQLDEYNVNVLNLSRRSINGLRRTGIVNLKQLEDYLKLKSLTEINALGKKSVDEILFEYKEFKKISRSVMLDTSNKDVSILSKKGLMISEVYSSKHKEFLEYCQYMNMWYIKDLDNFDFSKLSSEWGISLKSRKEIFKIYWVAIKDSSIFENMGIKKGFTINSEINDLSIESLTVLGVKRKDINKLKKMGLKTLKGINSSFKALLFDSNLIEVLKKIQPYLELPALQFVEQALKINQQQIDYRAYLMRTTGATLQEIAGELNLTRERIRQLEKRFQDRFDECFKVLVTEYMGERKYIYTDEIMHFFENHSYGQIVVYACKHNLNITYLSFADAFVKEREGELIEENLLSSLKDIVGEGINICKEYDSIEDITLALGCEYIGLEEIKNLLRKYGYKLYKDFVVTQRKSYGYLCAELVREHYPEGIKLNQNNSYHEPDLIKLRKLAVEEYGDLRIPDSDRAFSARISEFLVNKDRGIFTASDNIQIELSVIYTIKEFIDKSTENLFYYTQLFNEFEGILKMMSNVDNYYFLHGVLKLYYPNDYNFSRDYLTKKNSVRIEYNSVQDVIANYVIKKGKPVNKNELKRIFGFSDIMIASAATAEGKLIPWGYSNYYSIDLIEYNDDDVKAIRELLSQLLDVNNGYCSENLFFDVASKKMNLFFEKNGIADARKFYALSTYFCKDSYDFRRPHICVKGRFDRYAMKDIAIQLMGYPEILFYSSYINLSNKMKWSPQTTSFVFKDIEEDYFRISKDHYIQKNTFSISERVLDELEISLIDLMELECVTLIDFDQWDKLPDIGYGWNEFILYAIIDIYGKKLRLVNQNISDMRYQRSIIVKSDSDFRKYSEVVAHALIGNNIESIEEDQFLSFLQIHGFAYRTIPKELYESNIIKFDKNIFFMS